MIRELAPARYLAVVLTCCDCGRTFEPSGEDVDVGRTGCPAPDCGGWTFQAQLIEPATVPDEREPSRGCLP